MFRALGDAAAALLRRFADKLGGESDADLRARMLGMVRGRAPTGSRASIEEAIRSTTPAPIAIEFAWHRRDGVDVLMTRFRAGGR
jgi:hypothetical protein